MQLKEVNNKKDLDIFLAQQKHSQFLQSSVWVDFQASVGNKIYSRIFENNNNKLFFSLFKKDLPTKSYFYSPRIDFANLDKKELDFIFDHMSRLAKKEGVIFWRFDPLQKLDNKNLIQTIDIQPKKTIILNLEKSEDDLLGAMHQKTRYNIRLANKKGVEIVEMDIDKNFDDFWKVMQETSRRDGFRLHTKEYYKSMFTNMPKNVKLFGAKYKSEYIVFNIVSFFGNLVTYMHGASSNKYRNVMAPYAMQWYCIKLAKEKGYKYYDFYGIDEAKWPGVTRFKKGFGGEEIEYPGTFDFVFDKKWYFVYKVVRLLRRRLIK